MIGAALALMLLPSLPNPFAHHAASEPKAVYDRTVTYRLPGWRLAERRDSFTGQTSCRLSARGMRYSHGVLAFRFSDRVDTANALFRVDAGPVRTTGSVQPEAAGLGAALLSDNTYNPSDGRVFIPTSQLKGAKAVSIRTTPKARPRTFALDGLDAALDAARAQGCGDIV